MPEIDSSTAMLVRLASVGDEAGLATAVGELDTATLSDALERLALAHEAAALAARDGKASEVVSYRTPLLLAIREMTRRASEALLDVSTADKLVQPDMYMLLRLFGPEGTPQQPIEMGIEKPAARLLTVAASATRQASVRPESSLVAVAFSAIWLEAYFNQLVELIDFKVKGTGEQAPDQVLAAVEEQHSLERSKKSLIEKIAHFARALTGNEQDRGASPYQELRLLIALRDVLVHCWPTRLRGSGGDRPLDLARSSLHGTDVATLVRQLGERSVLPASYVATKPPILEAIRRPEVAKWALETAQLVARYIAESFPTEAMQLWAARENALSGAPPKKYRLTGGGIYWRVPD